MQLYVAQNGRVDGFLYFGQRASDFLEGEVTFADPDEFQYQFTLVPGQSGRFIFQDEKCLTELAPDWGNSVGDEDSFLKSFPIPFARKHFESFKVFHFHDTSFGAKAKQPSNTTDYAYLREDAGNLAAFLYRLQEKEVNSFRVIVNVVRSIAPFFDQFYLQPDEINGDQIFLRWREKGSEQL